ncbi:MAG: MerR family transcriptional regulator [Pyrinomonadaceae bacterium]|nr:MerR family transcriptional regulator [Pyrinomonadaceae bacterium]
MKHPVEKERGRKYVGLPEFAQTGERILSDLDLEQPRGTVTSLPDERTIRYYLAEGLIQPPTEKQGTASVFGYINLLQLVAVKQLQAEHLPIRKIRELVTGKSEQELEALLGIGAVSGKKSRESEAKRYLQSLLAPSMSQALESRAVTGTSRPTGTPRLNQMSTAKAAAPPAQEADQTLSWQRVEIEPGLELHIRSDYVPPATSVTTRSLLDRVINGLRRYKGK